MYLLLARQIPGAKEGLFPEFLKHRTGVKYFGNGWYWYDRNPSHVDASLSLLIKAADSFDNAFEARIYDSTGAVLWTRTRK